MVLFPRIIADSESSIEIKRIMNDLLNIGYIIGIDMHHKTFEKITYSAIMYMG